MRKSSNIKYFVSEGCKSYSKNALMSLASTVIVVASLIVLGIYLLFSMNLNFIANQLKEDCEIQVWIDDSVKYGSSAMSKIEKNLKAIENVNMVEYFSKEDALSDFKTDLGEDAVILDGLEGDNPIRNSFKVTLHDLDKASETAGSIAKINGVANVSDNLTSMNKLVAVTNIVKQISFWFMLFLCALAIFIISNTIKITLFARRKDINIMKYLGATDSFISWPFVVEGVVIGMVGAVISLIVVTAFYAIFMSKDYILLNTIEFCSVGSVFVPLLCWFVAIGGLLGAFGSAISIRRHLKV